MDVEGEKGREGESGYDGCYPQNMKNQLKYFNLAVNLNV
jgi:hypothetical protein